MNIGNQTMYAVHYASIATAPSIFKKIELGKNVFDIFFCIVKIIRISIYGR